MGERRRLFEVCRRLGRKYNLPVFVSRKWFTQFPHLQRSSTPRDVVLDHMVAIGPISPQHVESLQPSRQFVIIPD